MCCDFCRYCLAFCLLYSTLAICALHNITKRQTQSVNISFVQTALHLCECGMPNYGPTSRIVNGKETFFHEFPWLALLLYNNTFLCGGSIISDRYVISAAHCLIKGLEPNKLKVRVGEYDMCHADSLTTTFSINKIIKHKKYDKTNFNADIMLLRLSMRMEFNKNVRPICLPNYVLNGKSGEIYKGRNALVIGWGKTAYGAKKASCKPRKLNVPILPLSDCRNHSSTLFCAGYLDGEGDACQGDSGGPLQIKTLQNKFEIIGVVSNGIGCAVPGRPGLYTDVITFIPWIVKNIMDSNTCT